MKASQVIALLLPETNAEAFAGPSSLLQGATALMRDADGRMTIAAVSSDMEFMAQAMNTGCYKQGKPIIDPVTREIMGYELEMQSHPLQYRTRSALGI